MILSTYLLWFDMTKITAAINLTPYLPNSLKLTNRWQHCNNFPWPAKLITNSLNGKRSCYTHLHISTSLPSCMDVGPLSRTSVCPPSNYKYDCLAWPINNRHIYLGPVTKLFAAGNPWEFFFFVLFWQRVFAYGKWYFRMMIIIIICNLKLSLN